MNIPDEHRVPMESTVRNHSGVTMALLIDLYAVAESQLGDKKNAMPHVIPSYLTAANAQHGELQIGTATDDRTGTYLQLTRTVKDGQIGKPFLTIGQKWSIQQPNLQGNLVTQNW